MCVIQVKDRKLKSLPPKPPDPHEQLLQDIRAQPKLKPVKDGRLVGKLPGTAVLCYLVFSRCHWMPFNARCVSPFLARWQFFFWLIRKD